jgi:tetratricopeptide (TPR) repeat protein
MSNHISEIIKSLKEKELVLFCGAGISKNSGLPLANEMKRYFLKKLPINDEDIDEIMNSNLPFEAFMETLSENSDVSKILGAFKDGEPNTNHILIAKLAKNGYIKTIFTTNFDLLIEKALEKEGLEKGRHFEVYFNEEQFSEVDFDNLNKISVFKIHGSVDNEDSIRTTLKAVASRTLSDKRMDVIRYLFSTGNNKKVLILGYSCSDKFDITPQIQSIKENQKEITFVEHFDIEKIKIEGINIKDDKNPFKKFTGKRIRCDTDKFIEEIWASFQEILGEYESIKSKTEWKTYVEDWIREMRDKKGLDVVGSIFYKISNFNKSREYRKKALDIAQKIGDDVRESICYNSLGNAHYGLSDFRKAIECHKKALDIAQKIGDDVRESKCYNSLGNAHFRLGNFKNANEYYNKSLEIAKQIRDKEGESICYMNLGVVCDRLGNFKNANEYYNKSLEIKRETGDKEGESMCYMNIGVVCYWLSNFNKSKEYYGKSLEIAKEIGSRVIESGCCVNVGNTYAKLCDFKKAIGYYEKSLEIAKEIANRTEEPEGYRGLGNVYCALGDFKKAIGYYEKSLEIAKEISDKVGESESYKNLGDAYYNLKNFKKAIEYYLKAEKIFKETLRIHYLREVYKFLSLAYEKIGDYAKVENYKKLANFR